MGNIFGRDNNGRPFTGNVYNGNVTYYSNGNTMYNHGNVTYCRDGNTMYNHGNTSYMNNGVTIYKSGNIYFCNGKTYHKVGNTLFGSDGSEIHGYSMSDQDVRNMIFSMNNRTER